MIIARRARLSLHLSLHLPLHFVGLVYAAMSRMAGAFDHAYRELAD
jgi:hypothetical protein